MARRPFDPAALGWHKTDYRQGDVVDRDAVADVRSRRATWSCTSPSPSLVSANRAARSTWAAPAMSSRRPLPRTAHGGLYYTSSLAAYGYYGENPVPLTEDIPARGSPEHYYSAQKAECEALLRCR